MESQIIMFIATVIFAVVLGCIVGGFFGLFLLPRITKKLVERRAKKKIETQLGKRVKMGRKDFYIKNFRMSGNEIDLSKEIERAEQNYEKDKTLKVKSGIK